MTLKLEYQGVTAGFVLGRSRIGLDALDADATVTWLQALCEALALRVHRGVQRDGLVDSLDVGTLEARFLDAMDPTTDDNVRPNTPLRLVDRDAVRTSLYRSSFADGFPDSWVQQYDEGPLSAAVAETNGAYTGLRLAAGLSVQRTVHVPAVRRVVLSWTDQGFGTGTQTYDVTVGGVLAQRVTPAPTPTTRSFTVDVTEPGPLVVRFEWADWTGTAPWTFVHSVSLASLEDAPIFTGVVQDVSMTDERDGHRYVTLTAVDGRASLANTQRYGAITDGGVGFETWAQRINRLRASAQTSTAAPDADPERLVYSVAQNATAWRAFGTRPSGLTVETPRRTTQGIQVTERNTAPVSWGAQARGYEVTVQGLTVGATYRLTGTVRDAFSPAGIENTGASQRPYHWQAGVTGKGWGAEVELPTTGSTGTLPAYTFVATSTSHVVRVTNARAVNRTSGTGTMVNLLIDVQVRQVTTDPFLLRDVVYESTLANHFDLACNSVGARWWVDRTNVVQFRRSTDRPDVIAHLSDVHDEGDPLHVCYSDVKLGYDTRNAINSLSLTNHGRRFDTESVAWVADDQTSVHEDVTAIASWGARSASVDTSLYTGSGHEADVTIRAYQLLDSAVVPSVRPTSVRFKATESVLAGLDYYSRVRVTRRGQTWTCRVVGIEHEITPLDGHFITLTLREDY